MFTPRMFGKYYLYERLAVGGMAEIFKAKMFGTDGFEKTMVVKEILPQYARNRDFIQMFVDEAKITVSLSHGNIVPVYELDQIEGVYFIAMECVDGRSLGEVLDAGIDQQRPLSVPNALFVAAEILAGLDYAHRKTDEQGRPLGIVHRDVSPQNVLISYEGEVKLVDFGIARAATKVHATKAGVIKGKFGYMSPEQALGQDVDARSDVFTAGILLYEMLTLERLFAGDNDALTLDRVKRSDVPTPSRVNPALPPQLDAIVFKALARQPEDRYQTAGEMRMAVTRLMYSQAEVASSVSLSQVMHLLYAEELQKRQSAPPVVLPPEAQARMRVASGLQHASPPAAPRAAAPAVRPAPAGPEALFGGLGPAVGATCGPAEAHVKNDLVLPTDGSTDLEDDFSYLQTGKRLKWILILVVVAGLAVVAAVWGRDIVRVFTTIGEVVDESAQRLAQKKLGTLFIRSRPTGATVYFGNSRVGTTDMRIGSIDPNKEYELVLTLEGFPPFSRKVFPSDWRQDEEKMVIQVFKDWTADRLK